MSDLKEMRQQAGKTQTEFAESSGYSREYINALENGRRTLTRKAAEKLAPLYGTSPGALMGYENPGESKLLQEARDIHGAEIAALNKKHAEEVHALRKEIDSLTATVDQLRHSLSFAESMCEILKKHM